MVMSREARSTEGLPGGQGGGMALQSRDGLEPAPAPAAGADGPPEPPSVKLSAAAIRLQSSCCCLMFLGVAAKGFLAEVEWPPEPLPAAAWWRPPPLRPPAACTPPPRSWWAPPVAAEASERQLPLALLGLVSPCCWLVWPCAMAGAEPRRCLLGNLAAMAGLLIALPSRMQACSSSSNSNEVGSQAAGRLACLPPAQSQGPHRAREDRHSRE